MADRNDGRHDPRTARVMPTQMGSSRSGRRTGRPNGGQTRNDTSQNTGSDNPNTKQRTKQKASRQDDGSKNAATSSDGSSSSSNNKKRQAKKGRRIKFTEEQKQAARENHPLALQMLGCLIKGSNYHLCPTGCDEKPKVKLFDDGWTCMKCRTSCNGIDTLVEHGGFTFYDAVAVLNGLPTRDGRKAPEPIDITVEKFVAKVDAEVYQFTIEHASLEQAQQFYAQWGISPDAVAQLGGRLLDNPRKMAAAALEKFGRQRLIDAGLVTDGERGVFLVNSRYPVIEPHVWTDGRISSMQFRASAKTAEAVALHKKDPDNYPYKPKFMSLRGVHPDAQIGFGVYKLARLDPGSTVMIVEGFKDVAAAYTLGRNAYGLPGAGTRPPTSVLKHLAGHNIVVALDADEAGTEFRDKLVELLKSAGCPSVTTHFPACVTGCVCDVEPDGRDLTDVLQAVTAADKLQQVKDGRKVDLPPATTS